MKNDKIILIDGNSLAYRAYYAMIKQLDVMMTSEGLHTNAIKGFDNFLNSILKIEKPDKILIAWDAGKGSTTFRSEIFEDYKSGRKKTPEELREQIPYMKELSYLKGINSIEAPGFEADDIIGTISKKYGSNNSDVIIYTGDKDLLQLIDDNISVKITVKGVKNIEVFNPEVFSEVYHSLVVSQFTDYKALIGDKSDNYPGITGVGAVTAEKLLLKYKTLDGIYNNINEFKKSKLKDNLINDKEIAYRSKEIATILTDAPIKFSDDDMQFNPDDNEEKLIKFYEKLNFRQSLQKINNQNLTSSSSSSSTSQTNLLDAVENKYKEIKIENLIELNEQNIDNFISNLDGDITFLLETNNKNYHIANIEGFVIGNSSSGFGVSRNIKLLDNKQIEKIFESIVEKNVFNAKETMYLLQRIGKTIKNITFDLMISNYLIDASNNDNNVSEIANRRFFLIESDEEIYGKGAKFSIPEDDKVFFSHIVKKAMFIDIIKNEEIDKLDQQNQLHLYNDIELPLSIVLYNMELSGVKIDKDILKDISFLLEEKIKILSDKIFESVGETFNINSSKQLGEILFEKMGMKPIKKLKSGFSTSQEVLEKLSKDHPFIKDILEYRQLSKLNSTYAVGLEKVVSNDEKIHTTYLQTLTQTGRLSSIDPNLQNIPIKEEIGKQIRKSFVPSNNDGFIYSSDYSQIELRVLAHLSNDQNMISAFERGRDIHTETARRIFGLPNDQEVSSNERRVAKTVNFGIIYGMSNFGLASRLGISRIEAKKIINNYFETFTGVKEWIENTLIFAHENGYVETVTKRRRFIPGINSSNKNMINFSERTAVNMPVQGSASDIIKMAMIKVKSFLIENNLKSKLIIQVHDELVFDVTKEEIEIIKKNVPRIMDEAFKINIPLKVESRVGKNWYGDN